MDEIREDIEFYVRVLRREEEEKDKRRIDRWALGELYIIKERLDELTATLNTVLRERNECD